jgi:hypothetical protein
MKKTIGFLLVAFILFTTQGCVPLVVGAAVGGVGGYAASKDTIQGETDKPYEILWDAAVKVSKIRGTVKQEDVQSGCIYLDTDSGRVWIRLIRLTRTANRIRISARKMHLPNMDLAQDIYTKIMQEAR